MPVRLYRNASGQLTIGFVKPGDGADFDEAILARGAIKRLQEEFGAVFEKQQDDVLRDEVWAEAVVDGERIEASLHVMAGFSIRALEPTADRVIREIAGSFQRRPIEPTSYR